MPAVHCTEKKNGRWGAWGLADMGQAPHLFIFSMFRPLAIKSKRPGGPIRQKAPNLTALLYRVVLIVSTPVLVVVRLLEGL